MFVYLTLGKQLLEISPDQRISSMAMMISLLLASADVGGNLTMLLP
jgi:hypothetical protein